LRRRGAVQRHQQCGIHRPCTVPPEVQERRMVRV
jgi:hypothetical protein